MSMPSDEFLARSDAICADGIELSRHQIHEIDANSAVPPQRVDTDDAVEYLLDTAPTASEYSPSSMYVPLAHPRHSSEAAPAAKGQSVRLRQHGKQGLTCIVSMRAGER